MALETLKHRSQFLRVRGGGRAGTPSFVVEAKARPRADASSATVATGSAATGSPTAKSGPGGIAEGPRFGFTVTKKLGNAVVRNRIRRRLKAAVGELADLAARADFDYVIIAREGSLERPYSSLKSDLAAALARSHEPARHSSRSGRRPK